ncbi:MAG: hypothetical protein K0R98_1919 [Rickettsiaceae bacterium]|jgi:hypothetical protein|nr:hypothetical protein [Rickettsiaceae bacterium]
MKGQFTNKVLPVIHEDYTDSISASRNISIYTKRHSISAQKQLYTLLNENKDNYLSSVNSINNVLEVLPVVMYLCPDSFNDLKVRRVITPAERQIVETVFIDWLNEHEISKIKLQQIKNRLGEALDEDNKSNSSIAPTSELFRDFISTVFDLSCNKNAMTKQEHKNIYSGFLFGKSSILNQLPNTIQAINENMYELKILSKEWIAQLDGLVTGKNISI